MKLNRKGNSLVIVLFTALFLITVTSSIFETVIIRTNRTFEYTQSNISEVNSTAIIQAAVDELDFQLHQIDIYNKSHYQLDQSLFGDVVGLTGIIDGNNGILPKIEDEFYVNITDVTDYNTTYVKYVRSFEFEYIDPSTNTRYYTTVDLSLAPDTTGNDSFLNYAIASNNDVILNGGAYLEGNVAAYNDLYLTNQALYRSDTDLRLDSIKGYPDYNQGYLYQNNDFATVENTYLLGYGHPENDSEDPSAPKVGAAYGCYSLDTSVCFTIDTLTRTITPNMVNYQLLSDDDSDPTSITSAGHYLSGDSVSTLGDAAKKDVFQRFDLEKVLIDRIQTAANSYDATFTSVDQISTQIPLLFNDFLFNMPNKNYFEQKTVPPFTSSMYIAANENSQLQMGSDKYNVTIDTGVYWLISGIDTFFYSDTDTVTKINGKFIIDGDLYISGNVQISGSIFVTGNIYIGHYDYLRKNAATTNYWKEYHPTTLTNIPNNIVAMALFAYGDMKWYDVNRFDDITNLSNLIYSDDPEHYSPLIRGYFYAAHNNIVQAGATSIINIEGGIYAGGEEDTYARIFDYDNTVDFPNTWMDYNGVSGVIINTYRGNVDNLGDGPYWFTPGDYKQSRVSIHANISMYPLIPGFPSLELYGTGSGVSDGVQIVVGSIEKEHLS